MPVKKVKPYYGKIQNPTSRKRPDSPVEFDASNVKSGRKSNSALFVSKKVDNRDTKRSITNRRRIHIPKKQIGFKSCKPVKNIFELLVLKKMMCRSMVVVYKYIPPNKYMSLASKYSIKQIKEDIINKKFKIPPIIAVLINGVFNIISPSHAKIALAIKGISYKDIGKTDIGNINISLLIYPYISKDETMKMISTLAF